MLKSYRRDIVILFAVKLILLCGLFFFCFSPQTRPKVSATEMSNTLLLNSQGSSHARS